MPALILGSQDQGGRVQKDGPGGGIGYEGPGKGRGAPTLTFSNIFEPGRAVSLPWRDSLLRPATLPRTFIFHRNFNIPVSEHSNSIEISLFWCFQGHRLQGYPHQTLENLQAHPYCTASGRASSQLRQLYPNLSSHSANMAHQHKHRPTVHTRLHWIEMSG